MKVANSEEIHIQVHEVDVNLIIIRFKVLKCTSAFSGNDKAKCNRG